MNRILTTAFFATMCFWMAGCRTTPSGPIVPSLDDYKETARKAVSELIVSPAITKANFKNDDGQPRLPRCDIGVVRNATRERIVIEQVTERIMEELLSSGQITLVANDPKVKEIARLRDWVTDSKKVSFDSVADYYLEGVILQDVATRGSVRQVTYSIMLRLNDVVTESQIWKRTFDVTIQGANPNRRGGVGVF